MSHLPPPSKNEQFYKLKIKELHALWQTVALQKLAEFKQKSSSTTVSERSQITELSENQRVAKQILSEFVPLFKEIQAKKLPK